MRRSRAVRVLVLVAALVVLGAAGSATAPALATLAATAPAAGSRICSSGYVHAIIGGQEKCLKAGEFCASRFEAEYEKYGFSCVNGHLKGGPTATITITKVGRTVLLGRRTRTNGCRRAALPDRRCSPGAYYSRLTTAVICSSSFHTSAIRNVPQSEKFAVEREYGMAATYYGYSIEIDHIVPLELGGSNAIANLFPEPGTGKANYRLKDAAENRAKDWVCEGRLPLTAARRGFATDWETLYERLFGHLPTG